MKNFKEFKSEQQYVTEIGPIAGALMGAMALWGGYQAFKKLKSTWKGYKESKKEKKDNKENGYEIEVKTLNPATGKEESVPYFIDPKKKSPGNDDLAKMGIKIKDHKNPNNDDIDKIEKAAGADAKRFNAKLKGKLHRGEDIPDDDLPANMVKMRKDAEAEAEPSTDAPPEGTSPEDGQPEEDGLDRDEEGNLKNQEDAQKVKDETGTAPNGWITDPEDDTKVIKKESTMLGFGDFIAEDIIKDLKKAAKSKKDVEISLDDGADIPIDPTTADIFVKYIEGLSSSEKNKTIKQIQRTERGFMKVLGKAHEG